MLGHPSDRNALVDLHARLKFVQLMNALKRFFLFAFVGKILDLLMTLLPLKFTMTIKVASIGVKRLQLRE